MLVLGVMSVRREGGREGEREGGGEGRNGREKFLVAHSAVLTMRTDQENEREEREKGGSRALPLARWRLRLPETV